MQGQPIVSIIVPTCNRCEMTQRCLAALVVQSYRNLEIIVIDDASRDGTPAMLAEAAASDDRIRVLSNPINLGANASRRRGIRAASGEFVAFLDSDCLAEADWIEQLLGGFTGDDVAAVTGLVLDPPPRNIYDLTFRGTHRVAQPGPARRIVAGNLCVRRTDLDASGFGDAWERPPLGPDGQPDVSYSGACDEEGLHLALKAAGRAVIARPTARVLHEHFYDRRSFFRQAYHGGRAAAELVRRHGLPPRLDMLLFIGGYVALVLAAALTPIVGFWAWLLPAGAFGLALAAISYNDIALKGKTVFEWLRSLPVLAIYYQVRLFGYVRRGIGLRIAAAQARRNARRIEQANASAVVETAPIFILGNQKSGTSAIAALLGRCAGLETTIDLPNEFAAPAYPAVRSGEMAIDDFIARNRAEFARPIIKAPSLTMIHTQLAARFPESRFVMIVRHPRDNIRSLLDRIGLPGDLDAVPTEFTERLTGGRQLLLDGAWLGLPAGNYVEQLAHRWNLIADLYLDAPDSFTLVRYEDFLADKQGVITHTAELLGLATTGEIASHLDRPFQPAGQRGVDLDAFFGANLERIDTITATRAARLGY